MAAGIDLLALASTLASLGREALRLIQRRRSIIGGDGGAEDWKNMIGQLKDLARCLEGYKALDIHIKRLMDKSNSIRSDIYLDRKFGLSEDAICEKYLFKLQELQSYYENQILTGFLVSKLSDLSKGDIGYVEARLKEDVGELIRQGRDNLAARRLDDFMDSMSRMVRPFDSTKNRIDLAFYQVAEAIGGLTQI